MDLQTNFQIYFNVYGSVHRKNIPIYIQQDATLHSLVYLEIAVHVSGGISIHHQEHIQLNLQHLVFVTPLLLPAASGSCCIYIYWNKLPSNRQNFFYNDKNAGNIRLVRHSGDNKTCAILSSRITIFRPSA